MPARRRYRASIILASCWHARNGHAAYRSSNYTLTVISGKHSTTSVGRGPARRPISHARFGGRRQDDADGAVEMPYLLPRTPQHNQIETEWQEIKTAIADIFLGGLDRMQDAIRRMIRSGEIPTVKMFDWLLVA